ncbi:MAG TPA: class I SAM-dependent methyltransferase [Planctomycetota bacterium]
MLLAPRPTRAVMERPAKLEHYRDPEVAAAYDRRWASAAGRRRDARKARALTRAVAALAACAGEPVRSILDVPCGTGRFDALLGADGLFHVGADLSLAMLATAASDDTGAPHRVAADLAALPFRDGAFDAAVCIRFLHLVREPAHRIEFLHELARVSGRGVVVDYRHDRTLRVRGRRLRHRLGLLPRAPSNPSPAAIAAELQAAGLRQRAWLPVRRAPWLSDKVLVVATR